MPLPPTRPTPDEWPSWESQLIPANVITSNGPSACTLYRVALPSDASRLFSCLKVTCRHTTPPGLDIVDVVGRMRAVHRLIHPHLNRPLWLLDNGTDAVFCLFNFYPLGSVEDRIKALGTPLPLRHSRVWFSQTVGALSYVHARDIAHRHIKLTSLMIRDNGSEEEAVLGGFTPAALVTAYRAGTDIMRKTVQTGNLRYRAPEAHTVSVWPYDAKAVDMYAMGVCLFMMLNAAPPFDERLYDDRNPMVYMARQKARDYHWREEYEGVYYNDRFKHLVDHLLEPKPGMRVTADYVIGHCALVPP